MIAHNMSATSSAVNSPIPDQEALRAALAEFDAVVADARRQIMAENKKLDEVFQQQILAKIRGMNEVHSTESK